MASSPYEENIIDFNFIVKNHPELLSHEDRLSLEQLMANLPDEVEKISHVIAEWTEKHPKVFDALMKLPQSESKETGAGVERGLGGSTIRLTAKDAKDLIESTVRQSTSKLSSQTFQTSNDQHPSNPGT